MKSDKLALIEGKILNLMFFDINIPVVPIEIWLRVTHNQRQKTLKVASVLLFRHILKTKSWLECGFSLLNSRMWPGILRDDNTHAYSTFINCLRNVELVQCETQLNNYANTDLLARLDGRMRLRGFILRNIVRDIYDHHAIYWRDQDTIYIDYLQRKSGVKILKPV